MPGRKEDVITDKIYHVFNKSIYDPATLKDGYSCQLFYDLLIYYKSSKNPGSFSKFRRLPKPDQKTILKNLYQKKYFLADVLAYCFMPNHFHFLLKQNKDQGISKFMGDSVNAFTRHLNLKRESKGPIFLPRFKAVSIKSEEQLIHVSRYIHLNPYTSKLVKSIEDLEKFPWSSLKEYKEKNKNSLSQSKTILNSFRGNYSRYKSFVVGQADYQRTLEYCKPLETRI